jgi:hypothetical protein
MNTNKRNKRNQKRTKKSNRGTKGYTTIEPGRYTFLSARKIMWLKYCDVQTVSLATVTATTQVYNLNSLFDPDRTGTGHQPYGFDQIKAFYNRYRVLHTRWKLVFSPSSLTYAVSIVPMNGLLAASPVDLATFITAIESPLASTWEQGASGQSKLMMGGVDLQRLAGATTIEYRGDDRYEALVTASPAEVIVLQIVLFNPGGSTISINFSVELEYETDFHDPIILAGS